MLDRALWRRCPHLCEKITFNIKSVRKLYTWRCFCSKLISLHCCPWGFTGCWGRWVGMARSVVGNPNIYLHWFECKFMTVCLSCASNDPSHQFSIPHILIRAGDNYSGQSLGDTGKVHPGLVASHLQGTYCQTTIHAHFYTDWHFESKRRLTWRFWECGREDPHKPQGKATQERPTCAPPNCEADVLTTQLHVIQVTI